MSPESAARTSGLIGLPSTSANVSFVQTLVRSAVGIDESRGDRIEVVNMRFQDITDVVDLEDGLIFGFEKQDLLRLVEMAVLAALGILVLIFVVRPMVGRILDSEDIGFEGMAAGAMLPDGTLAKPALSAPGGPMGLPPMEDEERTSIGRQIAAGSDKNVADEIENTIDLNKIEGRVRASSLRKIGEIIQKHPDEAVSIIRSWLYEDT